MSAASPDPRTRAVASPSERPFRPVLSRSFRIGRAELLAKHARTTAWSNAARVHRGLQGETSAIGHIPSSRFHRSRPLLAANSLTLDNPRYAGRDTWWSQTGSNRRPHACKARALPTELWPRRERSTNMVGLGRLERPTSPLSGVRSNHLSYRPESCAARGPQTGARPRMALVQRGKRNVDGGVPQNGL